jgi:hypothetical protein
MTSRTLADFLAANDAMAIAVTNLARRIASTCYMF